MKAEFPIPEVEIIDCHIHPARSDEEWHGWFDRFDSFDAFIAEMRRSGIDRACGSFLIPDAGEDYSVISRCNRLAMQTWLDYPDFYLPGAQMHVRFVEESCRDLEWLHRATGTRWVGEVCGYLSGFRDDYFDPACFPIYDLAGEFGMAVNLHTEKVAELVELCGRFPQVNFVLAHPSGGRDTIRERVAAVAGTPNLYLDISGLGVTRRGMLRYAVDQAGSGKILFGSDMPITTPYSTLACVLAEALSDRERRDILSGNFKRLTGLA